MRVEKGIPGGLAAASGERIMLGTLNASVFIANFMLVCLFPELPTLAAEFHKPISSVTWAVIVVIVVGTGSTAAAAGLGVIIGYRLMLVFALLCILAGGVVAILAETLTALVIGRGIQGVGLSCQTVSIGIITNHWSGQALRKAISTTIGAMGLGTAAGYLAAGILWKCGCSWRVMFWLITGSAALTLSLVLFVVKETKRSSNMRVDIPGAIGLLTWSVLVLVPLSQAVAWGWGSAKLIAMLLTGVAVLVLWTLWELRVPAPLLNLRILVRPNVWQGAVSWFAIGVSFCVSSTTIPYLFETPSPPRGWGLGEDLLVVSAVLATTGAVTLALSPVAPLLIRNLGSRRAAVLGAVFGLAGFGLAFAHDSIWVNIIWLASFGVLAAWAGSASYSGATEVVPPHQGGVVSGLYTAAMNTGGSLAAALAGSLLSLHSIVVDMKMPGGGTSSQAFPTEETFVWSALLIGAMGVLNLAALITIDSKRSPSTDR